MTGKKGMITSDNLESLLSSNSWRIVQSVMSFYEWKKYRVNRHLWASLLLRKRNEGLLEVRSVALEELEMRAYPFLELRQLLLGKRQRGVSVVRRQVLRWMPVFRPGGCRGFFLCRRVQAERTFGEAGRGRSPGQTDTLPRLALSRTSVGPAPSGLVSSFVPVVDVEGNIMSPMPAFEREPYKASETGAPVHRGVLGATFGETSLCVIDDKLFHRPFDMEVRALKILGDLLLVQSRGIRECHALGLTPSLDKEGQGPAERMLLEFLPNMWRELSELEERIRLIYWCASRAEYRYHMLKEFIHLSMGRPWARDLFGTRCIMSEEEHRKVITARKRPKEAGYLEESLIGILSEARRMAREEQGAVLEHHRAEGMTEGERRFFFQLLEMGRRANWGELHVKTLELEQVREVAVKLHVQLDVTRAELSSNLGAEVATLRDWVVSLDAKEVELSSKLESSQAEIMGVALGRYRLLARGSPSRLDPIALSLRRGRVTSRVLVQMDKG
ncbi:hypothetical protein ACLOJK_018580, partial [Asimina triloba]